MKVSGGIVLYRRKPETGAVEVFLLHSGGPVYARRDDAWTIPKGEVEPGEDPLDAAWREWEEETGFPRVNDRSAIALEPFRVTASKILHAWLVAGDVDPEQMRSILFEWRGRHYPEADRAGWFTLEQARQKMFPGQRPLVDRIQAALEEPGAKA